MTTHTELIRAYRLGPQQLRAAVAGLTEQELDAVPVPGTWSTRQVLCHLADFEPIYADRMKRVIVEHRPTFFGGDPDAFATRLAYDQRDAEQELQLIELTRQQMVGILQTLEPADFSRIGIHSEEGPLDLETLLRRITGHIPHHVRFIEQKCQALREQSFGR